jgi:hypothetical protein
MQVTKSILCLWASCAAVACFMAYGSAYQRGALSVITMEKLDMGGGQSFALGFPTMVSEVIAAIGVFMAAISLLVSWRWNKQPLFSPLHFAALIFFIPLIIVWLIQYHYDF